MERILGMDTSIWCVAGFLLVAGLMCWFVLPNTSNKYLRSKIPKKPFGFALRFLGLILIVAGLRVWPFLISGIILAALGGRLFENIAEPGTGLNFKLGRIIGGIFVTLSFATIVFGLIYGRTK